MTNLLLLSTETEKQVQEYIIMHYFFVMMSAFRH